MLLQASPVVCLHRGITLTRRSRIGGGCFCSCFPMQVFAFDFAVVLVPFTICWPRFFTIEEDALLLFDAAIPLN